MRVGLFIPCYIDQFYPRVGQATVEVLGRFPEIEIDFPRAQTCCGQPMANTGCFEETRPLAEKFVEIFADYDHVVCPSGSCTSMVRNHYASFFLADPRYEHLRTHTWELCEFLIDVMAVESWSSAFPHRVGLHRSCHGLRELRLDACTELACEQPSTVTRLLRMVPDVELVELTRTDECCGFGGTFAVAEEGVSLLMGADRIDDHRRAGAEVMTATDTSCLMHMEGIARRRGIQLPMMHISQILAGDRLGDSQRTTSSDALPSSRTASR